MCAAVGYRPRATSSAEPSSAAGSRFWEVDVVRTLAIGLMVIYHIAYDVHMLAPHLALDPFSGVWEALRVTTGSTFLAVVGTSYWIADQRGRARGLSGIALWLRHARRGGEVLAAAVLVSVATLLALGAEDAVRFGILHLIATAVLVVLPLTIRLGAWNAVLGAGAVAVGLAVNEMHSDVRGALVLGFDPGYAGVDWYPLLPWIGATFVGVAIGAALYPDGERGPWLRRLVRAPRGAALVGAPGRRSLPIYLVHQPVLIALTATGLTLADTEVAWP